jgi:hypothetical protein
MAESDMLRGGVNTFSIDVNLFYEHWMPNQKNTVSPIHVKSYLDKILESFSIPCPILESITVQNDRVCIRSSDGRHRIAAAKAAGLSKIYVEMSDDLLTQISELFPGVILEGNPTHNVLEVGDSEDDSLEYEENFRFFQAYQNQMRAKKDAILEPTEVSTLISA